MLSIRLRLVINTDVSKSCRRGLHPNRCLRARPQLDAAVVEEIERNDHAANGKPRREIEMNDFLARIVAMANANDEAMRAHLRMEGGTAHMEEVWKILDSADVMFGIWQDPTEPEGVGYLAIKGEPLLADVVAKGAAHSHIINAISCQEAAVAYALHDLCLQRNVKFPAEP